MWVRRQLDLHHNGSLLQKEGKGIPVYNYTSSKVSIALKMAENEFEWLRIKARNIHVYYNNNVDPSHNQFNLHF